MFIIHLTKITLLTTVYFFSIAPSGGKCSDKWQALMYWPKYVQPYRGAIWQLIFCIKILQNTQTFSQEFYL